MQQQDLKTRSVILSLYFTHQFSEGGPYSRLFVLISLKLKLTINFVNANVKSCI